MSSTTSKLCLFRNYNYRAGEKTDKFVVTPEEARCKLGFTSIHPRRHVSNDASTKMNSGTAHEGSRHEGKSGFHSYRFILLRPSRGQPRKISRKEAFGVWGTI